LPGFGNSTHSGEVETTGATAHLPGLDIEIVHRRSPDGEAEQISINLKAVPSFEAFGRFIEQFNPLAFWAGAMSLAWFPWLEAARAALTSNDVTSRPKGRLEPPARRPEGPSAG
jgi:hypothetical protein